MRILMVAPPWFPVPPASYGGIELMVGALTDGLTARGHDVTLVASGGSTTTGDLRVVYEEAPSAQLGDTVVELGHVLAAYEGVDAYDVVHDHSGLIGPALAAAAGGPPVVHTLHGPWTEANARVYRWLSDRVHLVAISHDQASRRPEGVEIAGVVHNGIDLDAYRLGSRRGDTLAFVGRATPDKGPHTAIEVARQLGRRLVMAIKVNEPAEHAYFHEVLEPAMADVDVELVIGADHERKVEILSSASCTLVPIQWDEPFGLVMTESMACGTPVVAFARGSAPELIDDGVSGILVEPGDVTGMVEAVAQAERLDGARVRAHVAESLGADQMVLGYERLYEQAVAGARPRLAAAPVTALADRTPQRTELAATG